ncbi:hypothetical protein BS47DRAFT_1377186 [Hydnum rufescens UP504]|uniref:Drebrin-like protein n=1 Tax=Hydnum rufescens UP504 TaxID=1448309 RepID=A0A9P6ASX2_9AGAM|nr:hypothetical protein BS47DRAFT_1377186 [Hydnum rufescens UP504]
MGIPNVNWALFTYQGANDLKVQGTGAGGLEELEEEFSDGRIQYAFVRVTDPNTKLGKFVQINWCGDGVPEARKGLFHTHSTAVAKFLQGTHIVINARNEADVSPVLIMSRVNNASGSKYSVHKEAARPYVPIAPVGTNYTPVGKVDINELRRGTPRDVVQPVGSSYKPVRGELASIRSTPATPPPSAPRPAPVSDDWDNAPESRSAPPAPPSHTRPPSIPSASRPAAVAQPIASYGSKAPEPEKPAHVDRIAPNQPAYTPVQLPTPKKLVNPFAARAAEAASTASRPAVTSSPGTNKLTWSERQAQAKKQKEEEDQRSQEASAASIRSFGTTSGLRYGAEPSPVEAEEPVEEEFIAPPAPPPPPPPPPPVFRFPLPPHPEAEVEAVAEQTEGLTLSGGDLRATVVFPYEALESNEIDLVEGEIIEKIEQLDEGWWRGFTPSGGFGLFPANYVELIEEPANDLQEEAPPPPRPTTTPTSSSSSCCTCSYEAAEDNEISFEEGEKIIYIDTTISDDWWSGTIANGSSGLFPAAYVELQG